MSIGKFFAALAHYIALPFTYAAKVEKVLTTALKDEPELRGGIVQLVALGEKIVGDGSIDIAEKGLNIPGDLALFTDIQAFFAYFKATFLPLVEAVYSEVKTDVATPAPDPAIVPAETPAPVPAETPAPAPAETVATVPAESVPQPGPGLHTVSAA